MYARVRDAHTKSSPVIHVPFIITFLIRLILFFSIPNIPMLQVFFYMQDIFMAKPSPDLSFQVVGHANVVPLMLYASALDPTNYSGRNVI